MKNFTGTHIYGCRGFNLNLESDLPQIGLKKERKMKEKEREILKQLFAICYLFKHIIFLVLAFLQDSKSKRTLIPWDVKGQENSNWRWDDG